MSDESAAQPTAAAPRARGHSGLGRAEKRSLALLALPTLGLALSITVISTYVPVLARQFVSSSILIGLLVGTEGIAAVIFPVLVGTWSDRLRTPLGGRVPFLVVATPVVAAALVAIGLASSLLVIVVGVVIFFVAYFIAYEPYRALYPDMLSDRLAGRAQSAQAVARGSGTGLALAGGGVLLATGQLVPFAATAVVLVAAVAGFTALLYRRGIPHQDRPRSGGLRDSVRQTVALLADRPGPRAFLMANALWELALAAIKAFVVLWLTRGLAYSLSQSSAIIGAVALVILVAAAVSGKLADRYGRLRIVRIAIWAYGVGLLVPLVTTTPLLIAPAIPLIAFGGGVTMALPYALLMPMMPDEQHGSMTGLYSVSRGVGIMLGPLLGGVAVQLGGGLLSGTQGYAAVWLVASCAILGSLPFLSRVPPEERS